MPFVLVFTKADKLGASTVQSNIAAFKREMLKWWTELPPIFQTSSVNQQGRDELLKFIKENNETYRAEILTALQNE